VCIDYFVRHEIEELIFDGYVYYSISGALDDGRPIANSRVNFNIRMFCFLQR